MLKIIYQRTLFASGENGAHSYRIPTLVALEGKTLVAIVDQRWESQLDAPYTNINQVQKISYDQGKTWSKIENVLKLKSHPQRKASFLDGSAVYNPYQKTLHLVVDLFVGGAGLMPLAKLLNPLNGADAAIIWIKREVYLKLHDREEKPLVAKITNLDREWKIYRLKSQAYQNAAKETLEATDLVLLHEYDQDKRTFDLAIYQKKAQDLNFLCSLVDGKNLQEPLEEQGPYFLYSSALIYSFISYDQGQSYQLYSFLNPFLYRQDLEDYNAVVVSPGFSNFLVRQNNVRHQHAYLVAFYNANYAQPLSNYFLKSKDFKNWKRLPDLVSSTSKHEWLSETQLVERQDGTLVAFVRHGTENAYCVGYSENGAKSFFSPPNANFYHGALGCYYLDHLNAQLMHGLVIFKFQNEEYIALSLPKTLSRKGAKIILFKSHEVEKPYKIYDLLDESLSFGYSTMTFLRATEHAVHLGLLFEQSKKVNQGLEWVGWEKAGTQDNKEAAEMRYYEIALEI